MRAIAAVALLICLPAPGGSAERQATTTPATMPATRAADVLKGAVDPYEPAAERGRFFRVAGVDNELSDKEFAAARGRADSFARAFDRWEGMLKFDKNRNRTLDWFEADAYRQDLRKRVLKVYDTNKDGRLTGKERERANAALAAGRAPAAAVRPGDSQRAWMRQRMLRQKQLLYARHDSNQDGRIDDAERAAMAAAVRREAEAEMAEQRLRRWDANGDGKLGEAEIAAMERTAAEQRRQAEQWRRQQTLARWDENRDGQLDERETAAMQEALDRLRREGQESRTQWELQQFDLNDDGVLDDDERALAAAERARREAYARADRAGGSPQADRRARWQATIARWRLQHFDADGSGDLDEAENAAVGQFERRMRDVGRDLRTRLGDRDGDGEVSEEERAASREEWRQARWKIFAKGFRYMDADGDGQISFDERQEFQHRMQTGVIRYMEGFANRFDANRDGRLDERERGSLIDGIHKDFTARVRRFDANRDGRLSPDEAIAMMEDFVQRELGIRPSRPPEQEPERRP